jgi:hypothetical protein
MIFDERLQYAVESVVCIYLVKEHRAKMSCEMNAGVEKGRWKIHL